MSAPTATPRLLLLSSALVVAVAACADRSAPAGSAAGADDAAEVAVADAARQAEADVATAAEAIDAQSGTYTIDPMHTQVIARWNHLGFSNPTLNFADAKGEIVYDADNPSASSVQVTLPLSGITAYTDKFDQHLRSADFFEVDRFPEATFRSTSVTSDGGNAFTVVGDLTIKDTTRPVTLDVTLNGAGPHPMAKVPAIGFDATTQLKRSDFGLDYAAPAVSDEVEVRITTEALMDAGEATEDAGAGAGDVAQAAAAP